MAQVSALMHRATWRAGIAVALLLVGALLRLYHLEQDIPMVLGFEGDEGIYAYNAKCEVLFGARFIDDWKNYYISPVWHYLVLTSFKVLGVGLVQARLVSALVSLAALGLIHGALRRTDPTAALVALLLLATNFTHVCYSRVALMEPTVIMWVCASLLSFGVSGSRTALAASGLLVVVAVVTKSVATPLLAVPFIARFLCEAEGENQLRSRSIGLLSVVVGLALGTFWLGFLAPHLQDLSPEHFGATRLPGSLYELARNVFHLPSIGVFAHNVILTLLAAAFLISRSAVLFSGRRLGRAEAFVMTWCLVELLALSVLEYRPLRYQLLLLVPMALGASFFLSNPRAQVVAEPVPGTRWLVALTLIIMVVSSLVSFVEHHVRHPRRTIVEAAAQVRALVGPKDVLCSGHAMHIGLELPNQTVWILPPRWLRYKANPFVTYGVSWWISDGGEAELFHSLFPEFYGQSLQGRAGQRLVRFPGLVDSRGLCVERALVRIGP